MKEIKLTGMGLIVGLDGTGDGGKMYQRFEAWQQRSNI